MHDQHPTHSFDEPLESLQDGLQTSSEILLCLDFDGTLAPIVEDPTAAQITPKNREAVASLSAAPAVTTAVVSGRGLVDVRDRVSMPITYAGNHGLELSRNGSISVHPIARKRASLVDEVCDALEVALTSIPNCRVENKRLTGTVHLRAVPQAAHEDVRRITRSVVDRIGGGDLETSLGKRVIEISPSVPWGKGEAVSLIEESCSSDTLVCYIGDDVTDESAFRAIEPDGVGIHVGTDRPSVASCRVESPSEVASLLEWISTTGLEILGGRSAVRPPSIAVSGSD